MLTTAERAREIQRKLTEEITPLVNSLSIALHGPDEHGTEEDFETASNLRACVKGAIDCAGLLAESREADTTGVKTENPRAAAAN